MANTTSRPWCVKVNIVLLGSTGFVGTAIIEQGLRRGFNFIAVARDTKKLAKFGNSISVVKGDYFDFDSIRHLFKRADVVVNTIGPPENRSSKLTATDFADAMKNLVAYVESTESKRLIHIASAGTSFNGEAITFSRKFMRALVFLVAPVVIPAKEQELQILMSSSLNWTCIRPPLITKTRKSTIVVDELRLESLSVGVEQLANFILDCAAQKLWNKKAPFVSGK